MNGWVDKEDVVYIFSGKLHSHKNNLAICNKMSGSIGCYAKWNKSDGERQTLYTLMYMCNLKNKHKNENRLIDSENKGWLPEWRVGEEIF